jgi:FlaA1/EpsC-like NDP-sugar epimerase
MRRKLVSSSIILLDAVIVILAPFIALAIRFEGNVEPYYYNTVIKLLPVIVVIRLTTFALFGLYKRLWRYASINELITIVVAVSVGSIAILLVTYFWGIMLPKSIHLLSWIISNILIGGSRLFVRILQYMRQSYGKHCTNVLIVGAGDAGAMIAREIRHRYYDSKKLVGFIDDDKNKESQMLFGAVVLGNRHSIPQVVQAYGIEEIIIAIPSLDGQALRELVRECNKTNCQVKTVPGIYELLDGNVTVQQLRKIALEDLLPRQPVNLNLDQISSCIKDKRILVTGAGGSIGSELCRQIARLSPSTIVLVGKGENSIYEIDRELRELHPDVNLVPVIADIKDKNRINNVFLRFKPQVVFHAAAHKHVPLMEAQPEEAVHNNIFGTKVVSEAADRVGSDVFIMISTDKAVNPTSVMGATKRVAELVIQNMSATSRTKFAAVRFGNVLGSRGSVVPLFEKQIANGGPVTVTHPDMTRYFMTIPEATQLVLQAGAIAKGGEVFVLDMGKPVKIVEMARDLIELSGLEPGKDIEIKFTGLRPGEKLFEELLTAEEGTTSTKHKSIYIANLRPVNGQKLHQELIYLQSAKHDEVISRLETLVPTYLASKKKYCGVNTDEGTDEQNENLEHYKTVAL